MLWGPPRDGARAGHQGPQSLLLCSSTPACGRLRTRSEPVRGRTPQPQPSSPLLQQLEPLLQAPPPRAQRLPCCLWTTSGSPTNLPHFHPSPLTCPLLPAFIYFGLAGCPPYLPSWVCAPTSLSRPHRTPTRRRLLYLCIARVRAEGACHRTQPQPLFFILIFPFLFRFFVFFKELFFKLFLGL